MKSGGGVQPERRAGQASPQGRSPKTRVQHAYSGCAVGRRRVELAPGELAAPGGTVGGKNSKQQQICGATGRKWGVHKGRREKMASHSNGARGGGKPGGCRGRTRGRKRDRRPRAGGGSIEGRSSGDHSSSHRQRGAEAGSNVQGEVRQRAGRVCHPGWAAAGHAPPRWQRR